MADLLKMSDVVMENITSNLGVKTLLVLRKVNRALRSYVDDNKPDFQIRTLNVHVKVDEAEMRLENEIDGCIHIRYKAFNWKAAYVYEKQKRRIDGVNYMKALNSDLEILLKNQKPASEPITLSIHFDDYDEICKKYVYERQMNRLLETFLTELNQALTSRPQLIQIDSLDITVLNQKQVMLLLPLLNPKTLKSLRLKNPFLRPDERDRSLELNEIVQTEQWKNIREFSTIRLTLNGSLRDFAHISRLSEHIMTVTTADLIFLKEALMTMATPKNHKYYGVKFEDKEQLDNVFGPPTNDPEADREKQWEFDIPEKQKKVVIFVSKDGSLIYSVSDNF